MGREGEPSRVTKDKQIENVSSVRDSRTPPEPKSSIDSDSDSESEIDRERRRKRKSSKRHDSDLESDSDSDRERRRKKKSRSRKLSRRRYSDLESESESDGQRRKSRKKRRNSRRRYSDSESESVSESDRERRSKRKRIEKDRKKRKISGGHDDDDDDEDEKKGKRKKKEKREKDKKKTKKNRKKEKEKKGKTGAVTNSWGKFGIVRENDMWNKRPEFSAWLSEVKQVNLESLPTRDEKIMFKEYMEDYNTATFTSKKYYDLDAYHRRKLEKQMIQGFKKATKTERSVFNDEEQRRQEIQQAREKEKEKEVIAKMEFMKSGMAEDMKEQRRLQEEMAYLFKIGNVEAATAIQRKLEPDVPM